jgi:tetratricopeptide (TPR) repeat protein
VLTPAERAAEALYVEGDRRYAEGRYAEAVDLFRRAYATSPQPLLLYNMVNCLERLGEYAEAATVLQQYIDTADTARGDLADEDTLRQRLGQIRKRADERADERAELAALRARPATCPGPRPCPVAPVAPRRSVLPYILIGTGGAAVVSALVFGTLARNEHGNAVDDCRDGLCTAAAERALDRERRFALITDLSVLVGVAAAGAGTFLYLRQRREGNISTVAPSVSSTGVGVAVVGSF